MTSRRRASALQRMQRPPPRRASSTKLIGWPPGTQGAWRACTHKHSSEAARQVTARRQALCTLMGLQAPRGALSLHTRVAGACKGCSSCMHTARLGQCHSIKG